MSSILTAASALRNHQSYMDVVANNIANMNTIGFKSSRLIFADLLSRTLSPGAGPAENNGGINPRQIGLGVTLGSITTLMTQGILQNTGRPQDLAITGAGFFVYHDGFQPIYSRDGALGVDAQGYLVSLNTGLRIQGWEAAEDGTVNTAEPLGGIQIPIGAPMAAVATTVIQMAGNLNASTPDGESIATTAQFYDSLGALHTFTLTFTKSGANAWSVSLDTDDATVNLGAPQPATVRFDENGQLVDPPDGQITFAGTLTNGAADVNITLEIGKIGQLESSGMDNLYVVDQNGRAAGQMMDFSINETGEIVAVYTNGLRRVLGQLALAEFANPSGLTKSGQNGYLQSANSGDPQIVTADGSRNVISAGFLEMSNVDLTLEFSEMIRAQRGFQANSRVVTTSDAMIEELVNLVR